MAICLSHAKWLKMVKDRYGVDYTNTIMLGRQSLRLKPDTRNWKKSFNIGRVVQEDGYSENLFSELEGKPVTVNSMDYSDYEHATIIHDINKAVPDGLKNKFSVVLDGGTLEHIFNYPQGLRNAMEMVQMGGGYLILMTPANNECGHGFYQFSPELYYSLLVPENGFKVKHMSVVISGHRSSGAKFYQIKDNTGTGYRLYVHSKKSTYLFVLAQKVGDVPEQLEVQQSDYVAVWNEDEPLKKKAGLNRIKDFVKERDFTYLVGLYGLDFIIKNNTKKLMEKERFG